MYDPRYGHVIHKMAAGILCAAFSSLSSRKELMVVSPRTAAVKKCASDILEAIEKEEHGQTVADFAMKLLGLLRSPLEIKEPVTMARRRERCGLPMFFFGRKSCHLSGRSFLALSSVAMSMRNHSSWPS